MHAVALDGPDVASLDAAAWDRLATRALCANPFYGREHVLAALGTIDASAPLRALAVYRESELVGLFPYRVRPLLPLIWPLAEAATNRYQFAGLPLVAADCAAEVVGVWLDALSDMGQPDFWIASHVDTDSPLMTMIDEACARRGLDLRVVGRYRRPRLTRLAGGLAEHRATVIPKRRLREIERNMRRLREAGTLSFERTDDPQLVPQRLEQFLALEHAGWKGRVGTSFLSRAEDADFARGAYANAVVDSLLLDGEPIAISINVLGGRTVFTPKCTYDETWRRNAPGLVLEYMAVQQFYADEGYDEMDAATTVDGHVVSELWNGSKEMGRLVIGPADWRTRAVAALWEQLLALRARARRVLPRRKPASSRGEHVGARPILARFRSHADRLTLAMRSSFGGLFLAGALLALPKVLLAVQRHEPLAYGLTML